MSYNHLYLFKTFLDFVKAPDEKQKPHWKDLDSTLIWCCLQKRNIIIKTHFISLMKKALQNSCSTSGKKILEMLG